MSKLDASHLDTIETKEVLKQAEIAMYHVCLEKQRELLSLQEVIQIKRDAVIVELARKSPEKIAAFLKLNPSVQELDDTIMKLIEPLGSC